MIPDGYRSLTPYSIDADGAVTFCKKALLAKPRLKLERRAGKLGHSQVEMRDSVIKLADENPGHEAYAPTHVGGSAVALHLYVEDLNEVVDRAVAVGARLKRRVPNMFYGDRADSFIDPFGHVWHIATHIEEAPPDEVNRRAAVAMGQGTGR